MIEETLFKQVASELDLTTRQVTNTAKLLDVGNTIPFIARYRKEQTGELDETKIALVADRVKYLRELKCRQEEVIHLINEQGKLTPELEAAIKATKEKQQLEDLYRPFRPKRKTRAGAAKEKGLEPLAQAIASGNGELESIIAEAVSSEAVTDREEALQGALDIIAEEIADNPENRQFVRDLTWREGSLKVSAKEKDKKSVYEHYYDYSEPLRRIPPHRILAVNRGEKEDILRVKIEISTEEVLSMLYKRHVDASSPTASFQIAAAEDAYRRLLAPAVERELRKRLTEQAEEKALEVFAQNLRHLLLQPPIRNKTILAIDPAYRTGCKLVVVDPGGRLLKTTVVYPTPPQEDKKIASEVIKNMISSYRVDAICIGNGTASRETEVFIAELLRQLDQKIAYTIVNEAGASVYSASSLAREEFPELDVSERSAVSLARRLQDPLAELVKIDPKSLGVGQYQHDVNSKKMAEKLSFVVETVVNQVGVDLNTASVPLLNHVAGLSPALAKKIVEYRNSNGSFRNRQQLKEVPGLGPKTFEQCVGFLRIPDADDPLDNTPIHPESYSLAGKLLDYLELSTGDLGNKKLKEKLESADLHIIADKLKAGLPTLKDIAEAIIRPGRDPREEIPPPVFRTDVLSMEDLKPGMVLQGTVHNVVDFGAFVDIGVKQDGLVHISELADRFIKHPSEVVAVGDIVKVTVLNVDLEKERINLSMKTNIS